MPPDSRFKRGARATPRHKLLAARPHTIEGTTPSQAAYVPDKLSFWLNNQYGDCVTTEEAFKLACAKPEIFIADSTVKTWASEFGFLNGADLTDVMDQMARSGFQQSGNIYGDGAYAAVDYSNEAILQNAIAIAPVKIGIDADALPGTAGNQMGWYAHGGSPGQYANEDHCVSLCGYGPVAAMFSAVGVASVPGDWPATSTTAYLVFTWNSIGVVDHAWIMSTCAEAWLRNPASTVNGTAIPNPGTGPTPSPPVVPPIVPPVVPPVVPPAPPAPPVPETLTLTLNSFPLSGPFGRRGATETVTVSGSGPVTLSAAPVTDWATGFEPVCCQNSCAKETAMTQSEALASLLGLGLDAATADSVTFAVYNADQMDPLLAQLSALTTLRRAQRINAGSLTPAQWQAIITAVLQIVLEVLPIILGG